MKIVIDIDDEDYKRIKACPDVFNSLTSRAYKAIKYGTPLPKGHGRLIDADDIRVIEAEDSLHINIIGHDKGDEIAVYIDAPTIIEADEEE